QRVFERLLVRPQQLDLARLAADPHRDRVDRIRRSAGHEPDPQHAPPPALAYTARVGRVQPPERLSWRTSGGIGAASRRVGTLHSAWSVLLSSGRMPTKRRPMP